MRKAKAPLPTSVRVGALDYAVKVWNKQAADNTGAYGLCDRSSCTILVRTDVPEQKVAEVLLHEITHAAYDGLGLNTKQVRDEEEIVNSLGYIHLQVLRDNPHLTAYINGVFGNG